MDIAHAGQQINDHGYHLEPGFLPPEWLKAAQKAIFGYFPRPTADNRDRVRDLQHAVPFPFNDNSLNRVPFDPRVIALMQRLTGREDLRLTSSFVQAKYGTNYMTSEDQTLHNDAWNASSLLWPRPEAAYQRLFGILYLTDVDAETAPTRVVDKINNLGAPLLDSSGKASYPKEAYPSYYDRETSIEAQAGDLLLFTGDLVHRGTAYRKPEGMRAALFFNLHTNAAVWTDKHVWSSRPAAPGWPVFAQLVAELTLTQRELLGFPAVEDPYWNDETIAGVQRLYPDMDMAPYQRRKQTSDVPA